MVFGYKIIKEDDYINLKEKSNAFDELRSNIIESEKKSKRFRDRMFELNKMLENNEITYEEYRKLWSENYCQRD